MEHPAVPRGVKQKLIRSRDEYTLDLIMCLDWQDFNRKRGLIEGLMEAIRICEEVERELNR